MNTGSKRQHRRKMISLSVAEEGDAGFFFNHCRAFPIGISFTAGTPIEHEQPRLSLSPGACKLHGYAAFAEAFCHC